MQRAGQLAADGTPVRERREPPTRTREDRVGPVQFGKEVRAELKKVAWPTRAETLRLSLIVFIAILVLGAFIFFIDLGFGQLTEFLFPAPSSATSSAAAHAASLQQIGNRQGLHLGQVLPHDVQCGATDHRAVFFRHPEVPDVLIQLRHRAMQHLAAIGEAVDQRLHG